MLFTQLTFLLFFVLVVAGNVLTLRSRTVNSLFLVAASWVFFAYWSITDFFIFLSILVINFPLIRWVDQTSNDRTRKWFTATSLVVSLTTLAVFKYSGFFSHSIESLLKLASIQWTPPHSGLAIPLAISFYTFHIVSLVLDVCDRKYRAPNFLDYTLYISFFPHIIAGPIVRGDEILPAIAQEPRDRPIDYSRGFYLFVLGYFFKSIVGDSIADIINPCWAAGSGVVKTAGDAWCVAILYSCQIFADFAGYSWMAMGLAKGLGFDFPENFRAPYFATSFRTFWHKWHVTLSRFLSDYLYIKALGGSRCSSARQTLNLMLTMLLGGLWHGPAWTFVTWGAIHGGSLALERSLGMSGQQPRSWLARGAWFVFVQLTVLVAWVFFRAPDLGFAGKFLVRMLGATINPVGLTTITYPVLPTTMLLTLPVLLYHVCYAIPQFQKLEQSVYVRGLMTGALAYAIAVMPHQPQGFIYFVF